MSPEEKQNLILECTKIMAPLIYQAIGDDNQYHPTSASFVYKCVSAGTFMASEIINAQVKLDKIIQNSN